MLSFTVRMTFEQAERDAVHEILCNLTASSRREPGCVSYIPHTLETDPNTVVIYEQYRDRAASDFHRATPHFQKLAAGGLYQLMREREAENWTALI